MRTVILITGIIIVDAIERVRVNKDATEVSHSLVVTLSITLICAIFMDIVDFINNF